MKIAVSGKGGAGKTTVAAGLIKIFSEQKKEIIAVDCDPDISLGLALDFLGYEGITPISAMRSLIAERIESDPLSPQGFFKINPQVTDIPEKFCPQDKGVRLIVMGKVDKPQGGCLCPENTFIRSLVAHLVLRKDEIVVLDMPAGSEHLGRATAKSVDVFLIVVEPSLASIQAAKHIQELARGLGITSIFFVGNKIRNQEDIDFIQGKINVDLKASIRFNNTLNENRGKFVFDEKLHKEFGCLLANLSLPDSSPCSDSPRRFS